MFWERDFDVKARISYFVGRHDMQIASTISGTTNPYVSAQVELGNIWRDI
jgi:hypothetical protein